MMDGWVSGGLCVLIALFVWARERFSGLFFIACFVEKLACFRRENHARPDALVCAAPRRADPSRGAGRHGRRTLVSRNSSLWAFVLSPRLFAHQNGMQPVGEFDFFYLATSTFGGRYS